MTWEDSCANCNGYIDSMNGEAVSGIPYGAALTWCSEECLAEWADKGRSDPSQTSASVDAVPHPPLSTVSAPSTADERKGQEL